MGRLEVIPMNVPRECARNAKVAFDERSIDYEFRLIVGDLVGAPGLDLLTERLEIPLNPVHADRQRIHDREVLGVLCKNRREVSLKREIRANEYRWPAV